MDFKEFDTVFFDLDGTLTDSKEGIIRCLQYSLGKFGIIERDVEKLKQCIGPSLSSTYRERYGLSASQAEQAIAFYRERFEARGIRENCLYKGVPALLEALYAAGKLMVLATAKPTCYAQKILRQHKIAGYFSEVAGSNLDGTRADKGEIIAFAMAGAGKRKAARIVMVGDRKHDVFGARENRLPAIGVAYGYGTLAELKAASPDVIVHTAGELKEQLL